MDFKGFFDKVKSGVDKAKSLVTGSDESQADVVDGSAQPDTTPVPGDSPTGTGSSGSHGKSGSIRSNEQAENFRSPSAPDPGPGMPGFSQRQRGVSDSHGANRAPVIQNGTDDTVYMKRSAQVNRIEAMFGAHGPRISSYLLSQSLTPGGVSRVVQKLGLESRGREGADLAIVEKFLSQKGAEAFCKVVGLRLAGDSPAPPPIQSPAGSPSESSNAVGLRVRVLDMASQGGPAEGSGNAAALRARMNSQTPPLPSAAGASSDSGGAAALRARMNPQVPAAPPPPPPPPRPEGTGARPSKLDQPSTGPSPRHHTAPPNNSGPGGGSPSHLQKIDVKPINLSESRNDPTRDNKAGP